MQQYKQDFIEFLVKSGALKFGDFTLKSGRKAPYFLNIGQFNTGASVGKLGYFYAQAINEHVKEYDLVFGPSYKGIQLAVAAAIALYEKFGKEVAYAYNRKEVKDHGEGGILIGAPVTKESRVVILDDVITAGTALRQVMNILNNFGPPKVEGVVVAVDRMEKGKGEKSAIAELKKEFGFNVYSIVDIEETVEFLYRREVDGIVYIDDEKMARIKEYRTVYGAV